jgi:outer membrane receptor protein involved in Fe transport
MRGFDADHGTDVALSVDGVPVNMVSHGHGQGYADMHWVIPELVQRVDVSKGPYDPRNGDFATAGAIDLQTSGAPPENRATIEGGMFHSYRGLVIAGTDVHKLRITGAAEVYGTDGPFDRPQNLGRYNLYARAAHTSDAGELSLTVTGYGSDWNASGQIPLRLVRAGKLDRFGSVDPHEGGSSTRQSVVARYQSPASQPQRWNVWAYLVDYRFSLYSDFTFQSEHPDSSDMIHQRDSRTLSGARGRYERDDALGAFTLTSRFGFDLRNDRIANGLDHAPAREWAETLVNAKVQETGIGAFVDEDMVWTPWLRTEGAVRVDYMSFAVDDQLEDRSTLGTKTSGERAAARVSPKASLVLTPIEWLDLYGNFGLGFHSNDARGVLQGVTPMTQALAYEAGLKAKLLHDRVLARMDVFRIDLDSELVWVGDAGTTEARGRTRREGVEVDVRANYLPWLWSDLALSFTRARFRDLPSGENAVPLAPTRMISASLTAQHPNGAYAKASVLHLGDRAATEDSFLTAKGFTRVDLSGGYRYERYEIALSLENLLDTAWREAQFANTSRVNGENGPAACSPGTRPVSEGGAFLGCEDIHFTPGTPFAVRARASIYF